MKNRINKQENRVIITSIEVKDNNLLEVIDSTGRKEYFPDYAFSFLLDIMQECRESSDLMEYANLLNKYILHKDEDILSNVSGPVLYELLCNQTSTSTNNIQL